MHLMENPRHDGQHYREPTQIDLYELKECLAYSLFFSNCQYWIVLSRAFLGRKKEIVLMSSILLSSTVQFASDGNRIRMPTIQEAYRVYRVHFFRLGKLESCPIHGENRPRARYVVLLWGWTTLGVAQARQGGWRGCSRWKGNVDSFSIWIHWKT